MQNLKPILQHDFKDCGVCCMQWIIIYYGGYITLEKLREDTLTDYKGTNAYQIVQAFNKWGFDSEGVLEHDLTNKDLNFPFIAHLKLENGLEHFVVVKDVFKNNIYLMDPSIGYKKMSLTEFNKLFTGHIILSKLRDNLIKMDESLTIKKLFINILKREKFLISKIIYLSFIWIILAIITSFYLKVGSNLISYDQNYLKYLIIAFGILTMVKILTIFARSYYENHLSNRVDTIIYPSFLNHLFNLPLKNIKSRMPGEIVTRITELSFIKKLFTDLFVSSFLDMLLMILSLVILFILNKTLTIILILFIIVYSFYGIIISKSIYYKVLENLNYETDFNSVIYENITNLESIKNLNIKNIALEKIEKVLAKYFWNSYKFNNYLNLTNLGKDFLLELCFFLQNSVGLYLVISKKLDLINLFTFNIILSYGIDPFKNLIEGIPKFNYIKASFGKIAEFLSIEEEKTNQSQTSLNGDIVFQNVSYSYNNYFNVLNDVSFTIKENTHVLLNGPSGSGKSTICHLLNKDYQIKKGEILIGKENIKDMDIVTIRNNILYIGQNEELFTGTIRENILANRDIANNYFLDICKICEIEDIVSKKGLRYESLVEPASKNISGGERQRIILARGLLKNANIIILDEALSEVDKKLESKIIKNIKTYFKNKTIIYISHKNQKRLFENIIEVEDSNGLFKNKLSETIAFENS